MRQGWARWQWPKSLAIVFAVALVLGCVSAAEFKGFDSSTLAPVTETDGAWGLKIVFFNVGQADAILLLAPNGDCCLIDSGKTKSHGDSIADYLSSQQVNGVADLQRLDLLYTTHYDLDHIGGLPQIVARGIQIRRAYDQGLSFQRHNAPRYLAYTKAVGDANDNLQEDEDEDNYVRTRIRYGRSEPIGLNDEIQILCVSARGDTKGNEHDLPLDPAAGEIDENPGSIALLVRLGEFELYTAGDQTSEDWKNEPPVEESLIAAGALPGGNDIDLLKVNHHGSDTSTSKELAKQMAPEVAVISSRWSAKDELPKKTSLKQLQENRCYVLMTGDCLDPQTEDYAGSVHKEDDDFVADNRAVFNSQGSIVVLVAGDGSRYTVRGASFAKTFSAKDADNGR